MSYILHCITNVSVMALKQLILVGLVLAASAAVTTAAEYGGVTFDLLGVRVILYCSTDGNMVDQNTPPFRGADVKFQCGDNYIIINARTNDFGFSYSFANPNSVMPFFPIQSNCTITINTILSSCNSTLPSTGGLRSSVDFVGNSLLGNLVVANFAPTGFHYHPSI